MASAIVPALFSTFYILFLGYLTFLVVAFFKRYNLKQKIQKEGFSNSDRVKGTNKSFIWFDELTSRIAFLDEYNKVVVFNTGKIDFVKVFVNGHEVHEYKEQDDIKIIDLNFKIPQKENDFHVEFLHALGKEVEYNSAKNNKLLIHAFEWKRRIAHEKQIAVK